LSILNEFQKTGDRARYLWAMYRPLPRNRLRHALPAQLIVSLTSFAQRFGTLAATLKVLLAQSVVPDRLILWVGHRDIKKVPKEIYALRKHGLAICATDDIGPYTKIIPTLDHFPEAFIVTADDDIYYGSTWLQSLVDGYGGDPKEIICRRAHKVVLDETGKPLPYRQWRRETDCRARSRLVFPTGAGGVLYPPGCFHRDVTRRDIFTKLAPHADDLWLFWMAGLNHCSFRRTGLRSRLSTWPRTQEHGLWRRNSMAGGNDDQIERLASRYGYPFR